MNVPHRVGEVGVVFRGSFVDQDGAVIDLSAATTMEIRLKGPSGQQRQLAAAFPAGDDGTQGRIEASTISTTLNQPGLWSWQGHASGPGYDWFSDDQTFQVESNL